MSEQVAIGAERPARPWRWGGLFVVNMALISAASIGDLIEQPVPAILIALNMGLLVPMVRDAVRSVDVEARRVDVDLAFLGE